MNRIVKDLMVPISAYATVKKGATLFEAVLALEKAQENYDKTKSQHRAVLIMDNKNRIVGKLSQLNVLRAIESESNQPDNVVEIEKYGFSSKFIASLKEQSRLKGTTFKKMCLKPAGMKVEKFMKTLTDSQYVEEDTSLDVAIYQLLAGPFLSLMVVKDGSAVGVLRLTDIFLAVVDAMKDNERKK
ncbi:CBS domain-containing protein [bacterium]|nr:CBS domain-containing protein [bacterium]